MYKRKISIRAARVNAEMKQTEAGAVIQRSRNYISRMEKGEANPTQYELERLSTVYGWPLEEIRRPQLANKAM